MKDVVSRFIDIEVKPDEDSSMSVGAFSGVSSIVYTLMNFYMYTKRENINRMQNKSLSLFRLCFLMIKNWI